MKNKIDAVIFDLDGVIVHTDKFHYQAWKETADNLGVYFDWEINDRLRGVSRMESLEIILERFDGELTAAQKESIATEKNEIYKKLLLTMSPADLDSSVRDTLIRLRHQGYLLAIGSSSKNARLILERVGLEGFFDAISDGNNITKSKPDPEVFLKAAEYLKAEPTRCLVVEDADAGIEAGIAAMMKTAAIGAATESDKADINLKTFADLATLLC